MEYGSRQPPPDPDWCGTYYSNDGQKVTREDASALADALEVAVAQRGPGWLKAGELELPWCSRVDQFIAYCRAGEFRID
jgi:hypothetical protein